MTNCTVVNNQDEEDEGGGCLSTDSYNSIIYSNHPADVSTLWDESSFYFCCSPGLSGDGNITNNPQFVDVVAGNYRLQASSPCIGEGNHLYAPGASDLDGNPRLSGVGIDLGAYEYQWTFDIVSTCSANGSIQPSGIVNTDGTNFVIVASNYYHIADVQVNGVSIGSMTNFVWDPIGSTGTIYAVFSENLATNNTPEWWLAQYGWINAFDAVALSDQDSDGLSTWREYEVGTVPNQSDSDGDLLLDGAEVAAGSDPAFDDTCVIGQVESHSELFGLYPSNVVLDVAVGQMLLETAGRNATLSLQLEQADELGTWTNAGEKVEWQLSVDEAKKFFRVRANP